MKTVLSQDGDQAVVNTVMKTVFSQDGDQAVVNTVMKTVFSQDGDQRRAVVNTVMNLQVT
jgi:hypothetical protein